MTGKRVVRLFVTDLDNTLWDWFSIWHESFTVLLQGVSRASGIPIGQLESESREVHRRRGTSEYSMLLAELPSLEALHPGSDPSEVYEAEIHCMRSARKRRTVLYPGVADTLRAVKAAGVPIVAYTESLAFYSASRIRVLGLDGVIDVLYSAADHDFPDGMSPTSVRTLPDAEYGLARTLHRHTPAGVRKPDAAILLEILDEAGVSADQAMYVGDSLMKDVAMAQDAGMADALARYGQSHSHEGYALLQRVSHWSDEDVRREAEINRRSEVRPTLVLDKGLPQILDHVEFRGR